MADQRPHSTIINRSAREAFNPLGVTQKGRSRTWLDDHGWWLTLVEFQPSGWDRGTYLNVGAMWLWHAKDYFSFDVDHRAKDFIKYESDDQFELAIRPMIKLAVERIKRYKAEFSSVGKVAKHYKRIRRRNFWDLYNGGVACGIAGDASNAAKLLSQFVSIQDDRDWMKAAQAVAQQFLAFSHSHNRFRAEAAEEVHRARRLLKLSELPSINW
jgi:hypothetical protein